MNRQGAFNVQGHIGEPHLAQSGTYFLQGSQVPRYISSSVCRGSASSSSDSKTVAGPYVLVFVLELLGVVRSVVFTTIALPLSGCAFLTTARDPLPVLECFPSSFSGSSMLRSISSLLILHLRCLLEASESDEEVSSPLEWTRSLSSFEPSRRRGLARRRVCRTEKRTRGEGRSREVDLDLRVSRGGLRLLSWSRRGGMRRCRSRESERERRLLSGER